MIFRPVVGNSGIVAQTTVASEEARRSVRLSLLSDVATAYLQLLELDQEPSCLQQQHHLHIPNHVRRKLFSLLARSGQEARSQRSYHRAHDSAAGL